MSSSSGDGAPPRPSGWSYLITVLMLLTVLACFGGFPVVAKVYAQGAGIDPLIFCTLRGLISGPILLAGGAWFEGFQLPSLAEAPYVAVMALCGAVVNTYCYLLGVYLTNANIVAIMQELVPIATLALSLATRTEPCKWDQPHWWGKPVGVLTACAGAFVIIDASSKAGSGAAASSTSAADMFSGILILCIQVLGMSIYMVGQRKLIFLKGAKFNSRWATKPLHIVGYTQSVGAAMFVVAAVPYSIAKPDALNIPTSILIMLFYASIVTSVICYELLTLASGRAAPSIVVGFWPFELAVTLFLSYIFFDALLSTQEWIGAMLIIAGVIMTAISGYIDDVQEKAVEVEDEDETRKLVDPDAYGSINGRDSKEVFGD